MTIQIKVKSCSVGAVAVILAEAAKELIKGAIIGGLIGGLFSVATGGSFFEVLRKEHCLEELVA